MVISIALFGFTASGIYLNLVIQRSKTRKNRLQKTDSGIYLILYYSLAALVSFILLNRLPIDYFQIPVNPIQIIYLAIAYLLLAVPFFFTGLIISLAYTFLPDKIGSVYFSSMSGSACGAVFPVFGLRFFDESTLLVVVSVMPLLFIYLWMAARSTRAVRSVKPDGSKHAFSVLASAVLLCTLFLITPAGYHLIRIDPSPYKALSHVLQFPDSSIVETSRSIKGIAQRVNSPYLRFAPGLSLKFTGNLPAAGAVYLDADNPFYLYDIRSLDDCRFAGFTLSYMGYALKHPQKVLIIQNGGGLAIPCAIYAGAKSITVIEDQAYLARMIKQNYGVDVIVDNFRAFLLQSSSRFDLVHIENWGTSLPGSAALTQDHHFTQDAFSQIIRHLKPDGILLVSRRLLLPPSDSVRLWATAYNSLKSLDIDRPENHIVMARNYDTYTMVVSRAPLAKTSRIENFATRHNFDFIDLPDMQIEKANRYNVFETPFHFNEIQRLKTAINDGKSSLFYRNHLLDVAPQSDHRPFPYRILKWMKIEALYKTMGSRPYSLALSGEIVVGVVFVEAVIIGFILLALPFFHASNGLNLKKLIRITYFLSIGAGFMFTEMFFIKTCTMLFCSPVISFTVVLCAILIFSGFGGIIAIRMKKTHVVFSIFLIVCMIGAQTYLFSDFIHKILAYSGGLRYAVVFLILLPFGLLMGIPFPFGMRRLLELSTSRAYAWAANGCTSVIASIVCVEIALSSGIPQIAACAAAAYLITGLCLILLPPAE